MRSSGPPASSRVMTSAVLVDGLASPLRMELRNLVDTKGSCGACHETRTTPHQGGRYINRISLSASTALYTRESYPAGFDTGIGITARSASAFFSKTVINTMCQRRRYTYRRRACRGSRTKLENPDRDGRRAYRHPIAPHPCGSVRDDASGAPTRPIRPPRASPSESTAVHVRTRARHFFRPRGSKACTDSVAPHR